MKTFEPSRSSRVRLVGLASATQVLIALMCAALCTAPPADGAEAASPPTGKSRSPVVLRVVAAPSGDYQIAIPFGWVIRGTSRARAALATPAAKQEPVAYFLTGARVSDLRYQTILGACNQAFIRNPFTVPNTFTGCVAPAIRAQLADSSFRWKPAQALPALISALSAANPGVYGIPEIVAIGANEAAYRVSLTKPGRRLASWGHVVMAYAENPILAPRPGVPGVTSLAFIAGCEAPTSEEPSFHRTCAAILRSFRPDPRLVPNLLTELAQNYQAEEQILLQMGQSIARNFAITSQAINSTFAAVRQMQWQTFNQSQASRLRVAQDWMNALAGTRDFVDPQSGDVYNFETNWHNYRYNCVDAAGSAASYYASNLLTCAELGVKLGMPSLRPINPMQ